MQNTAEPTGKTPSGVNGLSFDELLFEEKFDLKSTGGVLTMGVYSSKYTVRVAELARMFMVSRKLDLQQLLSRRQQDIEWLNRLGLDQEAAEKVIESNYREFVIGATNDAIFTALFENCFTGEITEGGVEVFFIEEVDPNREFTKIDPEYWNDKEANAARAMDASLPYPEKNPAVPAEKKLGLISTLINYEDDLWREKRDELIAAGLPDDEILAKIGKPIGAIIMARYNKMIHETSSRYKEVQQVAVGGAFRQSSTANRGAIRRFSATGSKRSKR